MAHLSKKLLQGKDERMLKELDSFKKNAWLFEQLDKNYTAWQHGDLSAAEYQSKMEQVLKPSPYVLKYYNISFYPGNNEKIAPTSGQFFLSPDDGISIALKNDTHAALLFSLKSGESNRLSSLMAGNYQAIDALPSYRVYIFYKNKLIFHQGNGALGEKELASISSQQQLNKIITSQQMIFTLNNPTGLRIIISKRLGGYAKPLAYFSFTSCISLLLYYLYVLFQYFKKNIHLESTRHHFKSFGSSIQRSLFYLTFSAFVVLCMASLYYFNQSRQRENEKIKWLASKEIISTFQRRYHGSENQLLSIAKQHGYDFVYLDENNTLNKSFSTEIPGGYPSARMDKEIQPIKKEKINWKGLDLLRIWYPVQQNEDKAKITWIGIYFPDDEKKLNHDAADFIGALFSGYLFLLLSISAITIYMTHSLTHPLDQLGKHLGNLKIETNEKISWHKNDEVGQLVNAYNKAITALRESTDKLRKSEREEAWREMAKQVAHEIKNPLTPMKLSLQYLQRAGKLQPEKMQTLLPNLTATIMEQINTLDYIATSFSQFASMPEPEKVSFNLAELVEKTIDLYRHQMDVHHLFHYCGEASTFLIFADRHQIQRVINNLLNNAMQAIPPEKEGEIGIRLFQSSQQFIRLEIMDNGKGVENEIHEKIFSPYFTTKSSGTGLGLAMCKDIIESSGGKIGFHSTKNIGTCFWIEMPLSNDIKSMHSKTAITTFATQSVLH
jgi:signal transduction histidine kinase